MVQGGKGLPVQDPCVSTGVDEALYIPLEHAQLVLLRDQGVLPHEHGTPESDAGDMHAVLHVGVCGSIGRVDVAQVGGVQPGCEDLSLAS